MQRVERGKSSLEIEKLRCKLDGMIASRREKTEILECSEQLDVMINNYYRKG